MDIEVELLYTKEHEWLSVDGKIVTVGISDYAQEQLGDITFFEVPSVGDEVEQFGERARQHPAGEEIDGQQERYARRRGPVKVQRRAG